MLSAKWRPYCLGLNVLKQYSLYMAHLQVVHYSKLLSLCFEALFVSVLHTHCLHLRLAALLGLGQRQQRCAVYHLDKLLVIILLKWDRYTESYRLEDVTNILMMALQLTAWCWMQLENTLPWWHMSVRHLKSPTVTMINKTSKPILLALCEGNHWWLVDCLTNAQ